MGIHGFYTWVKDKTRVKKLPIKSKPYSFAIDLNSLFHDCLSIITGKNLSFIKGPAQEKVKKQHEKRLSLYSYEEFHKEYSLLFFRTLEKIIEDVSPSHHIILVIDGVAPLAKMNQQRKRRFYHDATDTRSLFNSNQISPGTLWMKGMEAEINSWMSNYRTTASIHFSSSQVRGEGEHKIFQMYRDGILGTKNLHINQKIHVVYGKDSDLFLIGGLCPLVNLYIYNDRRAERDSTDKYPYKLYSVDMFRKYISTRLTCKYSFRTFVIIMSLIGNDFINSLRMFEGRRDIEKCISYLIDVCQDNSINLIRENLQINSSEFARFFKYLSVGERTMIESMEELQKNEDTRPYYPEKIMKKAKQKVLKKKGKDHDWYPTYCMEYYKTGLGFYQDNHDKIIPSNETIMNICGSYIQMIYWYYLYYCNGEQDINCNVYYRFNLSPFASDLHQISTIMEDMSLLDMNSLKCIREYQEYTLNVIHQHLIIFPITCSHICHPLSSEIFLSNKLYGGFSTYITVRRECGAYQYSEKIIVPDFDIRYIDLLVKRKVLGMGDSMKKYNRESKVKSVIRKPKGVQLFVSTVTEPTFEEMGEVYSAFDDIDISMIDFYQVK